MTYSSKFIPGSMSPLRSDMTYKEGKRDTNTYTKEVVYEDIRKNIRKICRKCIQNIFKTKTCKVKPKLRRCLHVESDSGKQNHGCRSFLVITGYRADDSCFSFAQDFINGTISYRQLRNAMHLSKLGQQFVLKSKTAFERIRFIGVETAKYDEWYSKKMVRDKTARREYFSVERNQRQRGDLYITQILDEELTPDDPRLR